MISVIDLSAEFSYGSEEARKLKEACEGLGCVRLVNHGVPLQLMADVKSVITHMMDLPSEIKRNNKDDFHRSGYYAPTPENPHFESVAIIDARDSHALDEFCSELLLTPLQRSTLEKYTEAMHNLGEEVASKLAKSIGLESGHVFDKWICNFFVSGYNFSPETVGSAGVKVHTDTGFLTVLQDDSSVGGLEVRDPSGQYVAVDPLPGSFVLNLGDTGTIWSNGRLRNVPHRVQCKQGAKRRSIAAVLAPQKDIPIEAPLELVDAEHPRLFSPVTYTEIRRLRIQNAFDVGEVLDLVRLGA